MCLPVGGLGYRSGCTRVRLPVNGLGHSSERVRLNGCAYQLAAGALERVCLPGGGLGYSSERVHLNDWWAWIQF